MWETRTELLPLSQGVPACISSPSKEAPWLFSPVQTLPLGMNHTTPDHREPQGQDILLTDSGFIRDLIFYPLGAAKSLCRAVGRKELIFHFPLPSSCLALWICVSEVSLESFPQRQGWPSSSQELEWILPPFQPFFLGWMLHKEHLMISW